MITWMQKHKKWLIITVWVSTIAFVGAGLVGWGQYSYGSSAKNIAKVGDIEITKSDFTNEYSRLYSQFYQMFQGNFDKEKAKMFGLEKQALRTLINRALILNLAKEYDISVTKDEVLQTLTSFTFFQKDGKFDKKIYKNFLEKQNIKPKDFENDLKKDLIIQKTLSLFPIVTNSLEEESLNSIFKITICYVP